MTQSDEISVRQVGPSAAVAAGRGASAIINNIQNIQQRALTAAEEAKQARDIELELLAQGVGALAQRLQAQAASSMQDASPYKGLLAYGLGDVETFCGRAQAIRALLDHLTRGPLTVLHAESGAGKTSLLQAGIAARLIGDGHLAVYLRPYDADPVEFIKRTFLPDLRETPELASQPLRGFLRHVCGVIEPQRTLYLLIDQFEEFFALLEKPEHQLFIKQLAECLDDPGLNVRWLLALRGESFTELAEFEKYGITPFKNAFRLNHLTRVEAHEVTREPAARHGLTFEPGLVETILDSLESNGEVAPTQLQLVCSALTEDLSSTQVITCEKYDAQGGTEGILRDYLKKQLAQLPAEEREPAWRVLRALVTSEMRRAVRAYNDLAEELRMQGVSHKLLDTILARLVERRLLLVQERTTDGEHTYELAHDYLVREIELDPQEQARKAAQELLEQEIRVCLRHGTLIAGDRLKAIEPYRNELRFTPDAIDVFTRSLDAVRKEGEVREKERQAREKLRRRITLGLIIGLVVTAALALLALRLSVTTQNETNRRATSEVQAINNASTATVAQGQALFNAQTAVANATESARNAAMAATKAADAVRQAAVSHSLALSAYAQNALANNDPDLAVALALESVNIVDPPIQSQRAMADVVLAPGTRRVIDLDSGQAAYRAIYSSDDRLVMTGSGSAVIQLWDAHTGQLVRQLGQHVYANDTVRPIAVGLAFSADGQTAYSAGGRNVFVWDVATGHQIKDIEMDPNSSMSCAAFSVDRRLVAWGSWDGSVRLWDLVSGQEVVRFQNRHTDHVSEVAISPDGKFVLSASDDSTLRIWDASTGQELQHIEADSLLQGTKQLSGVAISPDGLTAATTSQSGLIQLWNTASGKEIRRLTTGMGARAIVFSPNGQQIAATDSSSAVRVWDTASGQQLHRFIGHKGWIFSAAYSTDGRSLVTASLDGTVRQWDLEQGINADLLHGHTARVSSLAFAADGSTLVSGSWDGSIRFWDLATDQEKRKVKPDDATTIVKLALSPDGSSLLVSTARGIRYLDVATGRERQYLEAPFPLYLQVGFSQDGRTAFGLGYSHFGSPESAMQLWDANSGRELGRLFDLGVNDVGFSGALSPDGRLVALGVNRFNVPTQAGGALSLWDMAHQQKIREVKDIGSGIAVLGLAFSPDSSTVVAATSDGLHLIDSNTGKEIRSFRGHTGVVAAVAFSPDGRRIISGGEDKIARLWDTTSGQEIQHFAVDSQIRSVAFDPAGHRAAIGTETGVLYLWSIESTTTSLVNWAHQNRYIREFTCVERLQFAIDPLCDEATKVSTSTAPKPTSTPTYSPVSATQFEQKGVSGTALPLTAEASSGMPAPQSSQTPAPEFGSQVVTDEWQGTPQIWTFDGAAGQRVSLNLSSERFDPYLVLRSPAGELLAVNDDDAEGDNSAAIHEIALPHTGRYAVTVDRFCAGTACGNGNSGPYALSIQAIGSRDTINSEPRLTKSELGRFGLSWGRQARTSYLRLFTVAVDSPADRAGLLPDDVIMTLNGYDTRKLSDRQVWDLLRGPVGLSITLTVARDGGAAESVNVVAAAEVAGRNKVGGAKALDLGDVEPSTLDQGMTETWTFSGHAGQLVNILMGGGDPVGGEMILQGPSGEVLAKAGDIADHEAGWLVWRWNKIFPRFRLPDTGTYTVTTRNANATAGTAPYTMVVYELQDQGSIRSGKTITGTLAPTSGQFWTFNGQAGQIVTARLKQNDGLLEPILYLVGPASKVVALAGTDQFDNFTAEYRSTRSPEADIVAFALPTSGEYTLIANPFIRQNPIPARLAGTYILSFDMRDIVPTDNLSRGLAVHGNLPVGDVRFYTYLGQAGERLTVRLNADKPASDADSQSEQRAIELGLLDTELTILAPTFEELASNDNAHLEKGRTTNSRIDQFVLPVSGTYWIVVRSSRNLTGGSYELVIESSATPSGP